MKRFLCLLLALCLVVSLAACGDEQKTAAEDVLRLYLATNEELLEAYEKFYESEALDPEGTAVRQVLEEQTEGKVSSDFVDAFLRGSTFSSFFMQSMVMEFESRVKSLKVEKAQTEGQYLYEAVLILSYSDGSTTQAPVNGAVQFNDEGLIQTISLGGSGMEAIINGQ